MTKSGEGWGRWLRYQWRRRGKQHSTNPRNSAEIVNDGVGRLFNYDKSTVHLYGARPDRAGDRIHLSKIISPNFLDPNDDEVGDEWSVTWGDTTPAPRPGTTLGEVTRQASFAFAREWTEAVELARRERGLAAVRSLPSVEQEQLARAAASLVSDTLARLFLRLGPPPEGTDRDSDPVASGDGGATP